MDPQASTSRLPEAQPLDVTVSIPTQLGQPIGFFPNAHQFEIHDSRFYDISGGIQVHQHTEKTELDKLQNFVSEDASYDSMARYPPPRCHPGTRVRVLEIITDWINDPDPLQRMFWLSGPAGAGKSAITQTVAEHNEGTHLAASFFFQRNTSDRGVLDRLFLTLTWQLAISNPRICPHLESTLKAERSIHSKSITVQFDRLFMKIVELLLRDEPGSRPEKGLVIVDALDECDSDQDQKTFLTLIGNKLASQKIPLRFLICSRPEPHIQETFNMDIMKRITRVLVLDEAFQPNEDIRKYLKDEFSRIFTERRISPASPETNIINRLVSEASAQFIYASTVIKFVDNRDCNPRKQLDIILKHRRANPTSPYTPLDQLYIQILSQQPKVRLLRDVFVLVIALGRVDFEFVCRRLRMSKEDLEPVLRRMHSILNISDVTIEAYHLSIRDFFQDRKRAGKYYIHPVRVTLVRLPWNIDRFIIRRGEDFLTGQMVVCVLVAMYMIDWGRRTATIVSWVLVPVTLLITAWVLRLKYNKLERAYKRGIWKRNTDPPV